MVLRVTCGSVKLVPKVVYFNHRKSGFRKMMNRYGLSVLLCSIPLLIWIGGVAPKWLPWKEVVEFVQMLPISSIVSLW